MRSGTGVAIGRIAVVAWALALAAPAAAQGVDQAQIDRLQQLIEQQQAQIQAQAEALRALQREVAQMRSTAVQANLAATEAAAAAQKASEQAAQAGKAKQLVKSGKPGIKLALSGQVNRGVLYVDDGNKDYLFHVDNDNSSTRIRFVGSGRVNEDFTVGSQIEVQFESNSTAAVNQFSDRGVGPNHFTERKLEVYFDSQRFGRLWLGQGDTASNGTSEVDLSRTGVISDSAVNDLAGGLIFSRGGVQPLAGDVTVAAAFNNLDGLSRDDRIRYDTPGFAGFKLSASAIAGGRWDVAGRYAGKFGGNKLAAALAYWSRPGSEGVNGSISGLHTSGLNLTFAAGNRDFNAAGRNDSNFWYAKLGYVRDFFGDLGKTAVAVDYFEGADQSASGDSGHSFGVFVVQNVNRIATEFYLGARVYDLDRPGVDFEDMVGLLTGARIKF